MSASNVLYDADCPHCWHGYEHSYELHQRELALVAEAGDAAPAYLHTRKIETARRYRIQPGDTLYRIAKLFTGNGARWPELGAVPRVEAGIMLDIPASWRKDEP